MDIDDKQLERLQDCIEAVEYNYMFLHTGLFFSELGKRKNLSRDVNRVWIDGPNKYYLDKTLVEQVLKAMHTLPAPDFFSGMVVENSVRGILMSFLEAMEDKDSDIGYAKKILISDVFEDSTDIYFDFICLLKLIRNVFSHNISYRTRIRKQDFSRQLQFLAKREMEADKETKKLIVKFEYNYPDSVLSCYGDYSIKIKVDFTRLEGSPLNHIIREWDLVYLAQFCYDCVRYIRGLLFENIEIPIILPRRFIDVHFSHFFSKQYISVKDLVQNWSIKTADDE